MRGICQKITIFLIVCGLMLIFSFSAEAAGTASPVLTPAPEHVQIKLYASVETVAPKEAFTLIIQQLIEPNWHTYWKNPGDSGTPLTARINLPDGGGAGELMFPTPTRLPFGPLMNFGYTHTALFAIAITPPAVFSGETYTVHADLNWLACNDVCLPEGGRYTLVLPVTAKAASASGSISDIIHDLTASHPMQSNLPVTYVEKEGDLVLSVPLTPAARAIIAGGGTLTFFPEEWGLIDNPGPQKTEVLDTALPVRLVIKRGTRSLDDIPSTAGVLVATDTSGYTQGYAITAGHEGVAQFKNNPEQDYMITGAPTENSQTFKNQSERMFFTAIFFAFLGGLVLNLMPCVFPVLALKILALSKLPTKEQHAARRHGFAYGAGVILSFCFIAATLGLLQQAGFASGWGFQLQEPLTVTLLFYLFILIGLNLMGVYELDLNRFTPVFLHKNHEGMTGSFLTGILATLVATPCTAPFMGIALAYGLTHSALEGLIVFAVMGFGLATPFVLLTWSPFLMSYLPRPGAWMGTLRHGLAFPMYMAAIWLLWVLSYQTGPDGAAAALMAALALTALLWLLDHAPSSRHMQVIRMGAIAVLVGTIIGLTSLQTAPAPEGLHAGSPPLTPSVFTQDRLNDALASNRPVFVNMTAAWCITCKVNERMALSTPLVQNIMAAQDMIVITGDWTLYNPDITAYLAKFGHSGVPLYVYYPAPVSAGAARPDPVVLPQILTPSLLHDIFTP